MAYYLHNAIQVVAHNNFWHITHQVVQPGVQSSQHTDGFATLPVESVHMLTLTLQVYTASTSN